MGSAVRRTSVAALAVATLTLVGGCGSSGSADHAGDTHGDNASGLRPGSAVNAVDARSLLTKASADLTSMRLTADVTGSPVGTLHMEGVERVKPSVAAQMAMSVGSQHVEVRMIGTTWYVQVPAAAGLPGGKKWISMDLAELGSLTGMDTSGMSDLLQDPAASISKLSPYVTGGTYVGTGPVDGVEAKQYDFTVDVKGALHQLMPGGLPSAAAGQVPDTIKESVWLDEQGRPVQLETAMGSLGTTTMHMSDFDAPVSVSAPPKDEVADMGQLMKSIGGAAAG